MCCFEIAATDREMNILELADCFQFNHDFLFYEEVQPVLANLVIAIKDWHWVLPKELNTAKCKFNGERLFINRFKETGSQLTVHTNRSSNDLLCDFGISQFFSCFPAFLIHS